MKTVRVLCLLLTLLMAASVIGCQKTVSDSAAKDNAASVSATDTVTTAKNGSSNDAATVNTSKKNNKNTTADYETLLFDQSYVHTIDVQISEADWEDLKTNPLDKTKYQVNITIDGETINDVSIATKGNTSLSSIASDPNSDRYSFKVNFGKFVDDQTYHGLNKLSLNNIYSDATYMKDYLAYRIFEETGVESPLTSYVWLTINGEDFGLYLAIEDMSKSYVNRAFDGEGNLYKPETAMLDGIANGPNDKKDGEQAPNAGDESSSGGEAPADNAQQGEAQQPNGDESSSGGEAPADNAQQGEAQQPNGDESSSGGEASADNTQQGEAQQPAASDESSSGGEAPADNTQQGEAQQPNAGDESSSGGGNQPGGMFNMFSSGAKGADLAYNGDDPENYSDIFDNAETKVTDEDKTRLINSLKGLSSGENASDYVNVDEVTRYFAAHNFVLNYDSYTGSMLHNYYLYEKDGKMSMLPWDYNLGFGGFAGGNDATGLINTGIDTPLSGASDESRPMWAWIPKDEDAMNAYHAAYDELLTNYFESGEFEKEIDALYEMIRPYVEKDPTAFVTVEQFDTAYRNLKQFCLLRAESIRKQLSGTLSANTNQQKAADRVDASSVKISAMGSQMQNNGGDGGFGGGNDESSSGGENNGENPGGNPGENPAGGESSSGGEAPAAA